MQKTIEYYTAAIDYNEKMAETAEGLSESLENEVVKRWCTSIGKQHRYHANLHRRALNRLKRKEAEKQAEGQVQQEENGGDQELPFSPEIKLDSSEGSAEEVKVETVDA